MSQLNHIYNVRTLCPSVTEAWRLLIRNSLQPFCNYTLHKCYLIWAQVTHTWHKGEATHQDQCSGKQSQMLLKIFAEISEHWWMRLLTGRHRESALDQTFILLLHRENQSCCYQLDVTSDSSTPICPHYVGNQRLRSVKILIAYEFWSMYSLIEAAVVSTFGLTVHVTGYSLKCNICTSFYSLKTCDWITLL